MAVMSSTGDIARIRALSCWSGPVDPEPLAGGITNRNFLVRDARGTRVVRIGDDIPAHGILRFNELAASRAAAAAGISPAVLHAESGVLVLEFIEGKTLSPQDVRDPASLPRIAALLRRVHTDVVQHLRGPVLAFNVFQVLRDYAAELRQQQSAHLPSLPALLAHTAQLERDLGRVDIVFSHNDLLAANLIDDGTRLWLIDWDYAGFNSPLFDLGGVCSNNDLDAEQTEALLVAYHGGVDRELLRRFSAMRCASLLREALWSMVSEIHSTLDFDYAAYTAINRQRAEAAWQQHLEEYG